MRIPARLMEVKSHGVGRPVRLPQNTDGPDSRYRSIRPKGAVVRKCE
jgi:hypothetical protein